MRIDELIKLYANLRQREAEIRNEYEAKLTEINKLKHKVKIKLLQIMQETGANSFKTNEGTVFKTVKSSCSVADWNVFFNFIKENELWHFIEHRANKTAVNQFKDEHGELPPGINWSEIIELGFRTSKQQEV